MILHHPAEELLLALAAGRLRAGQDIVIGAHVESCAECAAKLHMLDAVGGAMLSSAQPYPLAADALAATLKRLDEKPPARRPVTPADSSKAGLPPGVSLPASLRGHTLTPWRRIGPGRRFCRVPLPGETGASLLLLGIEPGRTLPRHDHQCMELTQVLCGAFADDRAHFGPGDFDAAGPDVHHEPVAQAGSLCVCLTWVEGRLRFESRIASSIAHWMGI